MQFIGGPAMNVLEAHIRSEELRISEKSIGHVSMLNCKVAHAIRPEHLVRSPSGTLTININNRLRLTLCTLLHGNSKQYKQKICVGLPGLHGLNKIEREMSFEVNRANIHLFCSTNRQSL